MSASLVIEASGSARLEGRLDFSTVPAVWPQLAGWIGQHGGTRLSLAAVDSANSAALALLLEARELAANHGSHLVLQDLPEELGALAELSNLTLADGD